MQITKRNGTTESYNREKIAVAIKKSFASTGQEIIEETIQEMVNEVEQFVHSNCANCNVERIQDEVERCLMEHGFYAEAKNYILYRWQRTERRKALNDITTGTSNPQMMDVLKEIQKDFTRNEYSYQGCRRTDHTGSTGLGVYSRTVTQLSTDRKAGKAS